VKGRPAQVYGTKPDENKRSYYGERAKDYQLGSHLLETEILGFLEDETGEMRPSMEKAGYSDS